MERPDDLAETLLQRGILEAEPDPAQPDVREHGVGVDGVCQDRTDHESGRRRGHATHAKATVCKVGKRARELVQPDRIAVHEEVPAACVTALGQVHQRPGTART
jgi:hypothetical protein